MRLDERIVEALGFFSSLQMPMEAIVEESAASIASKFKIPDYDSIALAILEEMGNRFPMERINRTRRYSGIKSEEFKDNYLIISICIFVYANHIHHGRHYSNIYDFLARLRTELNSKPKN